MSEAPSDDQEGARVARALRHGAVFDALDDAALGDVARLTRPLSLPRGARLDEPLTALGSISLIAEGRLRLYREAPTGRQVPLDLLDAGDLFRFLAREAEGNLTGVAAAVGGPATLSRVPGPRSRGESPPQGGNGLHK